MVERPSGAGEAGETGGTWDAEVDVVVVGFGVAGSAAAVQAADGGASVVALDRWGRGGASARSGGVVYAGGGTPQQRAAGFHDTPEQMEAYLSLEEGRVDGDLLHRFCARSAEDLAWLVSLGVGIPMRFDPAKSVVPPDDDVGLYYSGNEKHFAAVTPAVPRGHRVAGVGMTGHDLVATLHDAARARGVEVLDGARLVQLLRDDEGRVVGVDALVLPRDRATRLAHGVLYRLADAAGPLLRRVPSPLRQATDRFESRRGRRVRIRARRGVVLATGGFSFNRTMLRSQAPRFEAAMPLGTPGDDGSGILAGEAVGGAVRLLDHCGASRFVAPPLSFARGVLVDAEGERICDESLYAATLSAEIAARGGRAWLVVDGALRDAIRQEIRASARVRGRPVGQVLRGRLNHVLFPRLFGSVNLYLNRHTADSVDDLADRIGVPPDRLRHTIAHYNEVAYTGGPDDLGKAPELLAPLERPPFAAVPCHLDRVLFPAPCITLGGLDVDSSTQAVRREDGTTIPGLHAVGRCAVGVASRSYVSGLSLADCVFSGRNAGMALSGGELPATARRVPQGV